MTEVASYWDWKQNYLLPALMSTEKLGKSRISSISFDSSFLGNPRFLFWLMLILGQLLLRNKARRKLGNDKASLKINKETKD